MGSDHKMQADQPVKADGKEAEKKTAGGAGTITYRRGDATEPTREPDRDIDSEIMVIFHVCNDIDRWGKGFVMFVSHHWPLAKEIYHAGSKKLGTVSIADVDKNLYIANMIAQHGIQWIDDVPPIRYDALRECLTELAKWAVTLRNKKDETGGDGKDEKEKDERVVSFHGPRMGSGLAGGDWSIIEKIIEENLGDFPVYIYDYE